MIYSNTQGARTIKATIGINNLPPPKPSRNAFGASAIRKIGFNPFTGQQFMAPPTQEKPEGMASKKETEMIELELDDD